MTALINQEIYALSLPGKARLVDDLLAQIAADSDPQPIPVPLLSELERRVDIFDRDPASGCTLDELEHQLFPQS
jgi:putative addiction module component (TIGR02574 family)